MKPAICLAALGVAGLAIAGCAASSGPGTNAMGAGRACDLRIDVGVDHRCAVAHVTPPDARAELTNGMRTFELESLRPVR
jgi:hypothetical protein